MYENNVALLVRRGVLRVLCILIYGFGHYSCCSSDNNERAHASISTVTSHIIQLAQSLDSVCSDEIWPSLQASWQKLFSILPVEVRMQLYGVIEAVDKICADVSWLREACLSSEACKHCAQKHYRSLACSVDFAMTFSSHDAALKCAEGSLIIAVLQGKHRYFSRDYFDSPVMHKTGIMSRDVGTIEHAYHIFWRRVAHELSSFLMCTSSKGKVSCSIS